MPEPDSLTETQSTMPLGEMPRGFVGSIENVQVTATSGGIDPDELERRLLELGFVEGARVEILHEGAFGRDPIAVRVHSITVALRRREAMAIKVRPQAGTP